MKCHIMRHLIWVFSVCSCNNTRGTKYIGDISVIVFVCLSVCLFVCKLFSVKDFSATTRVRILKFGTKLDSDELYCVAKKTATYCLSVPLFVYFSFSRV